MIYRPRSYMHTVARMIMILIIFRLVTVSVQLCTLIRV